jgi:hypothetical protein
MSAVTNNESIVRKALSLALAVAIQATGLSAPFVHAHPDEHETSHHAGRTVHSHWADHDQSHHSSDVPAFGTPDHDRAVFLNVFFAVAASTFSPPAVTSAVAQAPVPSERPAHRVVEIAHGHDPPFSSSLPSRAPPAFLF